MIKVSDYNQEVYKVARQAKSGPYELKKYTYPKYDTLRYFDLKTGGVRFDILDGELKCLQIQEDGKSNAWMTQLPEEEDSYRPFVKLAKGEVLSTGLGIGLLTYMLKPKLESGIVTQLDIVEWSQDIINLTWDYQNLPEVHLIRGDAWDYLKETNKKYDSIFLDTFLGSSEAVARGPKATEIAKRCLNPGGTIRYWLQETREHLLKDRGPRIHSNEPCPLCSKSPHMSFYGGLCLECAEGYETWLDFHYSGDIRPPEEN